MVKMVIGEVQTQTEQIKAFGKTYSQALESVSSATQGILLVVGMSGQGMDSIKNYISSTYPALCKAVILHSEATVQANEQYLEGYTSQCGSEDLDSEELQDQINEADRLIQGFQSSKDSFAQAKRGLSEDSSKLMGMIFQAAINNMDAGITRNQAKKAKIEEKLRKFLAFCDKSPSYFDGLKGSEELMTKGMQALGVDGSGNVGAGSWNGKGFSLKDTAWIKDVNKNWNDRVERRDKQLLDGCKIIHVFDEKYGKDVYMFEKDGYHYALNEDDLSADLKKLIKKYGLDVLELSPTEMSKRVNDFQKSGRDYFSGDKVGMPGFGALAHGQDFMGKAQESGLWDAMWALGLTGAAVRNAQIYDRKVNGAKVPKVEIPEQSLKHANVGDFTVNPSTGKVSKMKGGGHGQSNIDFLRENGFELNIEKTYPNGVRIGNVPHHKTPSKRTGTGQAWFPENWTNKDIESAGQHIANQPNFAGAKNGEVIFGDYNGVRVGVIKTDGKIGTIFPDGTKQP